MQSVKIAITLLILIILGILVGSNLLPMMTVTILNQPTVTLPIGVWLAISVGLGLLFSSSIQFLLFLNDRRSSRKIRQLQSRLQQQDDDIFFTVPTSTSTRDSRSIIDPPDPKQAQDRNYGFTAKASNPSASEPKLTQPTPSQIDDDDWETEPVFTSPKEWDDESPSARKKTPVINQNFDIPQARIERDFDSQPVDKYPESMGRGDIYDAEFRLIQPPYKEPILDELEYDEELEGVDYSEIDDEEYADLPSDPVPSNSIDHDPRSANVNQSGSTILVDDEDWGFDFDDRDAPSRNFRPQNRKI